MKKINFSLSLTSGLEISTTSYAQSEGSSSIQDINGLFVLFQII